jgi:short-subunit dehydrogenase
LILIGALTVLESTTPYAISYGACKAAVHHLAQSLFDAKSPSKVVCLLPKILDTPFNRLNMPTEDFSKWTSTEIVAQKIFDLCSNGTTEGYDPNSVFLRV